MSKSRVQSSVGKLAAGKIYGDKSSYVNQGELYNTIPVKDVVSLLPRGLKMKSTTTKEMEEKQASGIVSRIKISKTVLDNS